MAKATTVIDVMLGEAGGKTAEQRYNDMLHIASSIVNRARMTGQSIEDIALSRSQYNAYGKRLPGGVGQYRDLAERALNEVLTSGPVTSATYYATPSAVDNLPGRLAFEAETANGHQYFSDPEFRGIVTRKGARQPSLLNPPTPEFREEPWQSAVPGAVERGLLDVPQDLQTPAVTPTEAYGLLASSMGQTPSLNLSGAGIQSPAADRMAGGMVANGLDGLRSGLLSSGSIPSREAQLAEMQSQANLQNEVNMTRGMVSQDRPYQAYQPEQTTTNPAVGAIEAVSPTTQQTTPSLADAYRQMGQSMEQGGILGASGLKVRDPNDILGVGRLAQNPLTSPLDSLPAYNAGAVDTATIEGPVTTGAIQTPEAAVEQDTAVNTTPQATQKQPSRLSRFARNAGASLLGSMAGGALGGPVGALIGGTLAREALGTNNQQPGLLGGIKGLLGDRNGGQGAWGGVGLLNDLGRGAQASYGAWGGPKGSTAIATDGSRITSLGNGVVSRIDRFGRETLFKDGDTWGGGGGTSGLLGGLFGGNTGDGSRSQADRARDSVGLY